MLTNVNPNREMSKREYRRWSKPIQRKMMEIQQHIKNKGVPFLLIFEGFEAAGKGTCINRLLRALDPRGFNVHSTFDQMTEEERFHPFLWPFWRATPEKGQIVVFDRSYYQRILLDRVEDDLGDKEYQWRMRLIREFEKMLADEGTVIVKFFLHISKKEQRKRLEEMDDDPDKSWRVKKKDWKRNKKYNEFLAVADDILRKTHFQHAPWVVVEATDLRWATYKILRTVSAEMVKALRRNPR